VMQELKYSPNLHAHLTKFWPAILGYMRWPRGAIDATNESAYSLASID
jgi:hypothetical protein